jgi:CheY-like chemotaxis protein
MKSMPKMESYDIIVLDEVLLNLRTIQYLKQIKEKKELKVVSLNSLLRVAQSNVVDDVVDKIMLKPLNQERIFEMITSMYEIKVDSDYEDDKAVGSNKSKIFKSPIVETKNIKQQNFVSFKNKHILIVEDNIINQKVLTNLLQPAGVNVTVANNGKEAVEIVKNDKPEKFDLVLMDINMPVMDGYAATQAIRYEQRFDSLPIIAFTALVMESETHKIFSSGVNAFLSKPLNIGKLYTALAMFLLEDTAEVEETEEKDTKHIHALPGLNVEVGIKHSNNSKALYMEILKEFDEAYGKSDQVFANLVKEHRFEQLKMLCLDMKGLTGSIGAMEMNKNIEEIHKILLYKKFELLPDYIEIYDKELAS